MVMRKRIFRSLKRLLVLLGVLLLLAAFIFRRDIQYGLSQYYGQKEIISQSVPISQLLESDEIADSIKSKLKWITEIKSFAEKELGLSNSENYSTFYQQKRKVLIRNLTAAKPFDLDPYEWYIPFLGSVSYKGYFDLNMLREDSVALADKGFDLYLRDVSAWSTLGYFRDPVFSEFMKLDEGQLANLIIHELTHGTVFVSGDINFNENLATYVGNNGARLYLRAKYGKDSDQLTKFDHQLSDDESILAFFVSCANQLDQKYEQIRTESDSIKLKLKNQFFTSLARDIDTLAHSLYDKRLIHRYHSVKMNNAFLLKYVRYGSLLPNLDKVCKNKCKGDLRKFVEYVSDHQKSIIKEVQDNFGTAFAK